MTRAAPVTQADIRRAVLALKAVGEVVSGVEIRPDRSVVILTGGSSDQQPLSALERWERENGHRAA
jgi:hypothetical protein